MASRGSGIPQGRHDGRPIGSCTWGFFVARSPTVVELRDRRNNKWSLDQVTICHGGWGFDDEGVAKLPRAAVYNAAGLEVIKADRVLILFLEGSRRRPVVFPGFRRIKATAGAFLPYHHLAPDPFADPNRYAARLQPKNQITGLPLGSVDVEAAYDGKAAARVSVGPANGGGPRTFVALDDEDGSVQAGTKDGAMFRLVKGQIAIVSAEGHVFLLDSDNGIQLGWSKGGKPGGTADPLVVLKEGLAQILATLTQIVGRVEFTDGVTPALNPLLVGGTAATGFLFDLAAAMSAIGALGAAPATTMATKITLELATPGTNPGYLSKTAKSS